MGNLHSDYSPSSSPRWMTCTASFKINKEAPEQPTSEYAEEGTRAHSLAEQCLKRGYEAAEAPFLVEKGKDVWSHEMRGYIQIYLDEIRQLRDRTKGQLLVEQKISFEEYAKGGFGTCDVIILTEDVLYIRDLKYGYGRVEAEDNKQLLLYALGAYSEHELSYDLKKINVGIIQPRLDHISEWEITVDELMAFGKEVKTVTSKIESGDVVFAPSEKACIWCCIKGGCKARTKENLKVAYDDFSDPLPEAPTLTSEELADLLDKCDSISAWIKDTKEYGLSEGLAGRCPAGYKIVRGQSRRKLADDAVAKLEAHRKNKQLFNRKPKGLTELETILGKRSPLWKEIVIKPLGPPLLVPESDKRPPLDRVAEAVSDFE